LKLPLVATNQSSLPWSCFWAFDHAHATVLFLWLYSQLLENKKIMGNEKKNQDAASTKMRTLKMCVRSQNNAKQKKLLKTTRMKEK